MTFPRRGAWVNTEPQPAVGMTIAWYGGDAWPFGKETVPLASCGERLKHL
jgi:hypothetical protein